MLLPLRDYLPPTLRNNAYRKNDYLHGHRKHGYDTALLRSCNSYNIRNACASINLLYRSVVLQGRLTLALHLLIIYHDRHFCYRNYSGNARR